MKIITKQINPSIVVRFFDWSAVYDNYEPGDSIGYGPTEAHAIANLKEQVKHENDRNTRRRPRVKKLHLQDTREKIRGVSRKSLANRERNHRKSALE
ncbi:MAG: hypothetical protein HQ513_05515 [Rhodospirillales bacterium]|nr:hypothetical protein [Rhodospirillales bacterium]